MQRYPQIPNTRAKRQKFLRKELRQFQGQHYCPALKTYVFVIHGSIKETAIHAGNTILSTKIALRLPYIIANAKIDKLHQLPKNNQQRTRFHFAEIGNLICGIRGLGTAKLTVGIRIDGKTIQYCVIGFKAYTK